MDRATHAVGFAAVGKEVVDVFDLKGGDDEMGAAQTDFLDHRFVFDAADKGFGSAQVRQFSGIGINGENGMAALGEGLGDGAPHGVHADHDAMPFPRRFGLGAGLLLSAEEAQDASLIEDRVECVGVKDEVGRECNRDEPDQSTEGHKGSADEPRTGTECKKDEGEFTDLSGGDGGMKSGMRIKAHAGENGEDEQRFEEQDKSAECKGGDPDRAKVLDFHTNAEGHEKDRDEEGHEGMEAPVQIFVHGKLRYCDPREEGPDLKGEMELVRQENDKEAPAECPDEDGVGGIGGPGEGAGEEVAGGNKRNRKEERHSAKGHPEVFDEGTQLKTGTCVEAAQDSEG